MILARLIGGRRKARSAENTTSEMPGFDPAFYLARNPDVAASGRDPLGHYLEHGWREGREPSAGFAGQRYLALNPDVQASDLNPLVHYLKYGLAEGRVGAYAVPAPQEVQASDAVSTPSGAAAPDPGLTAPAAGPTRLL